MNRTLFYLFIAVAGLLPEVTSAQYENVWIFGRRTGLDFNSGSPVQTTAVIEQTEGSASVCDAQGKLLFYSDGNKVWDRQHNLMPNSNNIIASNESAESATQAALIVPIPGAANQYYLFSTGVVNNVTGPVTLYYSIVDMTLNNGMGDIVPGKKGIVMDSSKTLTEKLTAIPGTNCNIWVIVCRKNTNTYLAYEVNAAGINMTPVISNSGGNLAQIGYILGSPNHRKLVAANSGLGPPPRGLILSDFDPATGIVSNSVQLDASEDFYGVGFSPDNTKLYATITVDRTPSLFSRLWQFDLSAPNPASAKTLLATAEPNFISGVKLGPDQKVYVITSNGFMGAVNKPNDAGTACDYVPHGARTPNPTPYQYYGIPNVIHVLSQDTISRLMTDTICDATPLTATDTTGRGYTWNDGSTGKQLTIASSGTYWVTYHTSCTYHQDSFHVYLGTSDTVTRYSVVPDPGCFIDEVTLRPAAPGSGYQWSNGSTNAHITVTQPGIYWARYSGDSCVLHIDSFEVHLSPEYLPATGTQSSCKNDSSGKAWVLPQPGDTVTYHYAWSDMHNRLLSSSDSLHDVPAGNYQLRVRTAECDTTITVVIPETDYTVSFNSDTLVCVGDTISFVNNSHPYFNQYNWLFGDHIFSQLENPVHAYAQSGTYTVRLAGQGERCADTFYKMITVDPETLNTSFATDKDTICAGEEVSFTYRKDSTVTGLAWNTGDNNNVLTGMEKVQYTYREPGVVIVQLTVTFRKCREKTLTDTVYVYPIPVADLGPDLTICENAFPVHLANLLAEDSGYYHRWHTGAITRGLKANTYGIYTLTVTSPGECTATDTLEIIKDCYLDIPNVFTPNGDGLNDYFFSRAYLSGNLVRFNMEIYNRWGQLVYSTTGTDSQGWDGTFKGRPQPDGVYVYQLEAVFGNGRSEKRKGNVTLMR